MDRSVPYDPDVKCDQCGEKGAFDFMGDYYCDDCWTTDDEGTVVLKEKDNERNNSTADRLWSGRWLNDYGMDS